MNNTNKAKLDEEHHKLAMRCLNRLTKWRVIFCGWQLGTRSKEDPESQAVSCQAEATLMQRAEVSALANLLVRKGLITRAEYMLSVAQEADALSTQLEKQFPGARATDEGMVLEPAIFGAAHSHWKP